MNRTNNKMEKNEEFSSSYRKLKCANHAHRSIWWPSENWWPSQDCNDRSLAKQIDVAALQETRLPDSWYLKEEHYIFWQGRGVDECREHGIRFAARITLLRMIEPLAGNTERILNLCPSTYEGLVNLVSIYAITLQAELEVKDQFYSQFENVVKRISAYEHIYLLREFNAKVVSDQLYWSNVLGYHEQLFISARLRVKTKVRTVLREIMFADDAALITVEKWR